MSLLDRRSLILAPLALAACGFTPVYGPGGTGAALRGRVRVDEPQDRAGYVLVRELETRLGRAATPDYALGLTITVGEDGLAIDRAGNTARYNLVGAVDYTLTDLAAGRVASSGRVENFTGYSATGTTIATLAAEQAALDRLMVILAEQVVTRLYAADLSA
jgi:LPS-assembly lipoprotein